MYRLELRTTSTALVDNFDPPQHQQELSRQHMRITSITVAFNPDPIRLAEQLTALRNQVDEIIIVDNGSEQPVMKSLAQTMIMRSIDELSPMKFIVLAENQGIASGFNIGIDAARKSGVDFVLLLDDDSVPAANMVSKLTAGYHQATTACAPQRVAAVGPRIVDSRDDHDYPFIRLGWLRNQHIRCAISRENLVDCDFLISSGSLILMSALDEIGKFDETLFIDSVDLEWCFRVRRNRLSLYGICDAQLHHRLGDHRRVVWNKIVLVVHSPLRIYYITRNRILLYWRRHVPLRWKLKDMLRMAAKFIALMLFVAPRLQYLRMTVLAVWDGIANRGGRLRDHR